MLLERVLRFFVVLLMAIVGGTLFELAVPTANDYFSAPLWHTELGIFGLTLAGLLCILTGTILGGIIGYPLAPFFTGRLKRFSVWVEGQLGKMPTRDVIAGAIGLFIGLIIARLLGDSFSTIPIVGDYIPIVFSVVLGYLGVHIMVKKQQEITEAFDFIPRFLREMTRKRNASINCSIRASSSTAASRISVRQASLKERCSFRSLSSKSCSISRILRTLSSASAGAGGSTFCKRSVKNRV